MKIILTGSLGHIGRPLTALLVQKGHDVTVISSSSEKQNSIRALGATPAIGTIEDTDFLTATFSRADIVYTMVPPPRFSDPNVDLVADMAKIIDNYHQAIRRSGIKRIVHLSSIGAHMDQGSGIIIGHHHAEALLNLLPDVAITFMRPVGFYYNLNMFTGLIRATGRISSNYGADDMIPWVSPSDIAEAIAKEIGIPPVERKILYVASDELTCNQVAAILGAAIGKPGITWTLITDGELQKRYESVGMNTKIAAGLVQMQASMHSGKFYEDYYRNRPAPGKIKMTDFANEFAASYHKSE
ncbi:MAG TPA: NAD(P)H-binding protein [Puia sp.]|nr:NAD(P)H-binding protein [Puia sp.]